MPDPTDHRLQEHERRRLAAKRDERIRAAQARLRIANETLQVNLVSTDPRNLPATMGLTNRPAMVFAAPGQPVSEFDRLGDQWARDAALARERFEQDAARRRQLSDEVRGRVDRDRVAQTLQREQLGRTAREQAATQLETTSRSEVQLGLLVAAERAVALQRDRALELEHEMRVRDAAEQQLRESQLQRTLTLEEQARVVALEVERRQMDDAIVREQDLLRDLEEQYALLAERALRAEPDRELGSEVVLERDITEQAAMDRLEEERTAEKFVITEAERWNDIAAWEASRRVAMAESEIAKIMASEQPDLRKVTGWLAYANRDASMVANLRNPQGLNGRTTRHYRPLVSDVQVRNVREDAARARNGQGASSGSILPKVALGLAAAGTAGAGLVATAAKVAVGLDDQAETLMAIMQGAVDAGNSLGGPEQGLEHDFVHPFEPVTPPGVPPTP